MMRAELVKVELPKDSRSTAGLAYWPVDCRHTTSMTELAGTPESVSIMGVCASIWFTDDRDDVVSRTCQCVRNNLDGM